MSALYPPIVSGGYEVECSVAVEGLRKRHQVLVLTSDHRRASADAQEGVRRELARLAPDRAGALRAPAASVRAVACARRALDWRPDLVYVWNGAGIPQACLRVLADSGTPMAFRVCEQWFGGLFVGDQFMRELLPGRRPPARAAWAAGCRALNAASGMRLDPTASLPTAISWSSRAMARTARPPGFVEPLLEQVCHPVPAHGAMYASIERRPAREPQILFIGRVTPYKGLAVALEALALLRDEHGIAAQLVVLGPQDAAHAAELRARAAELGLDGAVDWRGQADAEQVAAALAQAHALIVPSTWEEPFGLVAVEGAFARVPLVLSDVGGIGEGMRDGEHALLFARGDASAAAAALARALTEPEQTAERVRRAFARAQSQFTVGPYVEEQERFVLAAHRVLASMSGRGVGYASPMPDKREEMSREVFTNAVRTSVNKTLSRYDHHPHGGYTPAAFRHYIRELALLDALAKMNVSSALDVGCAEGYFMKVLRDSFGWQVWGVDLSTVALAKAHDKHGLTVAAADATRLPFADGSFDLVYSTEVIEHVLDPDLMIAEMRRVSRGTVLVTTPVSQTDHDHEPDFELREEGHINNFDRATVERLFGPDAHLGSFRCNATLAPLVAVGRHMPAGVRDGFYKLDHEVAKRWGSPNHRVKALRNRDWLITVPATGEGDGVPAWRCPACHGELSAAGDALACSGCSASYPVADGVPDFFAPAPA